MSRISIIQPEEATGRLKEIYDQLEKQRGQIAEVHKMQSLRPESIVKHMDLYMEIMYSKSDLSRSQREMMAVVVSKTNNCKYCIEHHASALNKYWKDESKIENLKKNFLRINLNSEDLALCIFSKTLTKNDSIQNYGTLTHELREVGFSDMAILDAALVVSYFNFVNRMVLSLGVELESDKGENYKY
ncbi:peroxidase-related enzyme [Salegentibacter sp. JZCK2]|uniref:peroxidase-related enzyme n=1 Tax=Salegentibacter tibetensis TaxID=2873600 RepID=UPI001CCC57F1|nr:peroxidase-related enzyme [Salegentibacter tibetensis]MBZ9731629.1 peroxidase-related enzyme [Salegentibacter tibetensis]